MKKQRWLMLLLAVLFCTVCLSPLAQAAETYSVTAQVTFGQTEARSMLDSINAFRHSDDAWYWNTDNTSKVYVTGLSDLKYDYQLEAVAMERAAELAAFFAHTRPDGNKTAYGENIALGYGTAEDVFIGWREDDEPYEGQGHRINMLRSYQTIGIGHAIVNGIHLWVQEFSYSSYNTANDPGKVDGTKTLTIPFKTDTKDYDANGNIINSLTYDWTFAGNTSLTVTQGNAVALPELSAVLGQTRVPYAQLPGTPASPAFSVSPTSVAKLENGKIVGVAAGTATLKATVFGTQKTLTVTVKPQENAKETLTASNITLSPTSFTYNGSVRKPTVAVKNAAGKTLTENTSYTLSWSNADSKLPGSYTVTVTGKGNYTGSVEKTYTIARQSLTASRVSLSWSSKPYSGSAQKPTVTVKNAAGGKLTEGTSYTVSWSNADSKLPGSYTVTVTGKGNYTGSGKKTYTITKQTLTASNVTLSWTSKAYNGSAQKPTVTVINAAGSKLTEGTSYTVTWSNADSKLPGSYTVTVTGKGNYTGSGKKTYTISKQTLKAGNVSLFWTEKEYSGDVQKPAVTVKNAAGRLLTEGTSYEVKYSDANSTYPGSYTVTVTGKGNYAGTVKKTYKITDQNLENVTLSWTEKEYNGSVQKPAVTVKNAAGTKLTEGTSYTVSWSNANSKLPGSYTVTVTGKGNYKGQIGVIYYIELQNLLPENTVIDSETMTATVKNKQGKTLTENVSYQINWNEEYNNYNGAVTFWYQITGIGNYTGAFMGSVETGWDAPHVNALYLDPETFIYNGSAQKPDVYLENDYGLYLTEGVDYTVSYANANSKLPGQYNVTVTGIGGYAGFEDTVAYVIEKQELFYDNIWFNEQTGKAIVRNAQGNILTEGVSYQVEYDIEENGEETLYFITVTGKGNYTGDATNLYIMGEKKPTEVSFVSDFFFDGQIQKPEDFVVWDNRGEILTEGIDYVVSYQNPNSKTAGEYEVYINGIGDYEGRGLFRHYYIHPQSLSAENVWYDWDAGKVIVKNEQGKTLTEGVSYLVDYTYCSDGSVVAEITGKGNYTDWLSIEFGQALPS